MRKKEREISDMLEIESIIKRSDVCRIAFTDSDIPYIVTMNFGFSGINNMRLYFHCANEGRKLEMIKKNNYVCFEMDTDHRIVTGQQACDFGMKYSSVVGYGYISIVNEPEEKISGLDFIMSHYTGKKDFTYKNEIISKTTVLRLDVTEITGKHR
jgi:nitroimidazol reductase NimA-like FMN-containing flavoprotein (pyridoxamine 5'-phosphate oxidase superfamily)